MLYCKLSYPGQLYSAKFDWRYKIFDLFTLLLSYKLCLESKFGCYPSLFILEIEEVYGFAGEESFLELSKLNMSFNLLLSLKLP